MSQKLVGAERHLVAELMEDVARTLQLCGEGECRADERALGPIERGMKGHLRVTWEGPGVERRPEIAAKGRQCATVLSEDDALAEPRTRGTG